MNYLFGDSTPSPFQSNFIEFLRLAMGFFVHVLRVEERVVVERARRIQLDQETQTDRQRLHRMLERLNEVIKESSAGTQPRVADIAEHIQRRAQEVVEAGLQSLELTLGQNLAEIEHTIRHERKSCVQALEKVLLAYDLPQAEDTIRVRLSETGRYSAWLESVTPYGLETVLELGIPPESLFAHDGKVERLMEGLEIHAPETGGWIRRESRMVPQKLGRFHIVELSVSAAESLIKLRSGADALASGYDIEVRSEEPRVRLAKTGKDIEEAGSFDPEPGDVPDVLRFRDKVEEASRLLVTKPRALVGAKISEQPLEDSERMRTLVEQLVQVLAPMVRDISAHSLSPDELVLRRMKADDRREEIFVSKAELLAHLEGLRDDDRRLFEPLELDGSRPPIKSVGVKGSSVPAGPEAENAHPLVSRARPNHSSRPPAAGNLTAEPRD